MELLSVLPGRIRLENRYLAGSPEACSCLALRLMALSGVGKVASNPRTGRVLVHFDEKSIQRQEVLEVIEEVLEGFGRVEDEPDCRASIGAAFRPRQARVPRRHHLTPVGRHLLRDVVAHALLPSPLDLLLPTAMAVFGR